MTPDEYEESSMTFEGADYDFEKLKMSNDDVIMLSEQESLDRLNNLILESNIIFEYGVNKFILNDKKKISNVCALFSGGNDSTILLYLFKDKVDFAIHINTTIGIPDTFEYVSETCEALDITLKVYQSKEHDSYENLVSQFGFPGPAQHYLMYQRLKERALRIAVKDNNVPKKERIVFLSGKRRDESSRRMLAPEFSREKSVVWIAPIINWTKSDINLYRKLNPEIPRNPVSDTLHMSGECMCGAFAKVGEKEMLKFFYPDFYKYIMSIEDSVCINSDIKQERKLWGWGVTRKRKRSKKTGELCSSCEVGDTYE